MYIALETLLSVEPSATEVDGGMYIEEEVIPSWLYVQDFMSTRDMWQLR